eukprot:GHRQ01038882.1.p1 GENE.GHRQ01038882.1~~GHRQ01038882.1.p1  ORF type:complete len:188 (+),score=34.09 GHRQ01038882.1:83-646(+)
MAKPSTCPAPVCYVPYFALLAGAARKSNSADVGCLFLAHQGAGAYVAPLNTGSDSSSAADSSSLRRINVRDESDVANARFMESFESRHSDHSFTAAVVSGTGRGARWFVSVGGSRWCAYAAESVRVCTLQVHGDHNDAPHCRIHCCGLHHVCTWLVLSAAHKTHNDGCSMSCAAANTSCFAAVPAPC